MEKWNNWLLRIVTVTHTKCNNCRSFRLWRMACNPRCWLQEQLIFFQLASFIAAKVHEVSSAKRWNTIQILHPQTGLVVAFHRWFNRNKTGWIWGYFINLPCLSLERKLNQMEFKSQLHHCAQGCQCPFSLWQGTSQFATQIPSWSPFHCTGWGLWTLRTVQVQNCNAVLQVYWYK